MLIKIGLMVFSPIQVAGIRLTVAGIILLPWVIKYSIYLPYISPKKQTQNLQIKDYLWLMASGVFGNAIPAYFFATAGRHIPSGLSGVLNAFTPMFTLLLGICLFKEKMTKQGAIGVFLGLIGAIFLFVPSIINTQQSINPIGALMPLMSAVLYGLNINIIKNKFGHLPGMVKTAYPFFFVGILYSVVLLNTDLKSIWDAYPGPFEFYEHGKPINANTAFTYLFALGFVGSAVSMIIFNYVIKFTSAVVASTNTFIIPITAVILGFFDSETLYWNTVVGMFFLLTAVYLIIKKR